jgi:colicin import membrane protein
MKRILLACVLFGVCALGQAQVATHEEPTEAERQAQSQRLIERRKQLEDAYKQDMQICYQKFDVISCRNEARERRIHANAVLRQEELKFNASERQIKAAEVQRRIAEKQADAQRDEAQTQRAESVQQAKDRAERNAEKQVEHANKGGSREAYEAKQREAAEHRANLQKKLRERDKPPAASLPVPGASK